MRNAGLNHEYYFSRWFQILTNSHQLLIVQNSVSKLFEWIKNLPLKPLLLLPIYYSRYYQVVSSQAIRILTGLLRESSKHHFVLRTKFGITLAYKIFSIGIEKLNIAIEMFVCYLAQCSTTGTYIIMTRGQG